MVEDAEHGWLNRPIFVGGNSRSGTTVTGHGLLDRHEEVACTIPAEMWFLTDAGGLCDMADRDGSPAMQLRLWANTARRRQVSPDVAFRDRMEGFWYRRQWWQPGVERGLFESVDEAQLAVALDRFEFNYSRDSYHAARQLAADLIDPSVLARGKTRWVDTTPRNARRSERLHRLFPDMKLINMVRDGRDVAASIVNRAWGTDDYDQALQEWYKGMREGHAAISQLPPGTALTVQLEELLGPDRKEQYTRLRQFLDLDVSKPMRRFFRRRMGPDQAHQGRWRDDLTPDRQRAINDRYSRMIKSLVDDGVRVPAKF
jgi:hypothetical protein